MMEKSVRVLHVFVAGGEPAAGLETIRWPLRRVTTLGAGDAVALSEERTVRIEGIDAGEVLVFDLA